MHLPEFLLFFLKKKIILITSYLIFSSPRPVENGVYCKKKGFVSAQHFFPTRVDQYLQGTKKSSLTNLPPLQQYPFPVTTLW